MFKKLIEEYNKGKDVGTFFEKTAPAIHTGDLSRKMRPGVPPCLR
jgi:hypothetical protein